MSLLTSPSNFLETIVLTLLIGKFLSTALHMSTETIPCTKYQNYNAFIKYFDVIFNSTLNSSLNNPATGKVSWTKDPLILK